MNHLTFQTPHLTLERGTGAGFAFFQDQGDLKNRTATERQKERGGEGGRE